MISYRSSRLLERLIIRGLYGLSGGLEGKWLGGMIRRDYTLDGQDGVVYTIL
jgi:hypothetical protein